MRHTLRDRQRSVPGDGLLIPLRRTTGLAALAALLVASPAGAGEKEEASSDAEATPEASSNAEEESEEERDHPPVSKIVHRTNVAAYYEGDDGRARVKMTIEDDQGRTRHRRMTMLRKDESDGGEQKYYVYFQRPADIAKTVFMVHKHPGEQDDRWLYLPGLDQVKRIAASDKRTSFVGSHFLYEDVSGRSPELDEQELAKVTGTYYVLDNEPEDPDAVEFSRYRMWIHKDSYLPVKTVFYGEDGEKRRVYRVHEVETIDGHPTVTKSSFEDVRGGGKTVLEFSDVDYDVGLPDSLFTERWLRRRPTKWLH